MSYLSISKCVSDADFNARVTACFADEGGNPYSMPNDLMFAVAAKDDIEAAYKYALDTGDPTPGGNETVITDAMILSAVQSIMLPPEMNP